MGQVIVEQQPTSRCWVVVQQGVAGRYEVVVDDYSAAAVEGGNTAVVVECDTVVAVVVVVDTEAVRVLVACTPIGTCCTVEALSDGWVARGERRGQRRRSA